MIDLNVELLKARLFEAFDSSDRQLFSTLSSYCSTVPGYKEAVLRELLDNYCRFHKKGQFKDMYELRPEYQNYEEDRAEEDEQLDRSEPSSTAVGS